MSSDSFEKGVEDLESGPDAPRPDAPGTPPPPRDVPPHPTVEALRDRFANDGFLRHEVVSGDEHIVYLAPDRAHDVLVWLNRDAGQAYDYLKDVTGVDYGNGRVIQVVYELRSMTHRRELRVKVELPVEHLETESVVYLWRSANWLEREAYDMFGVTFTGHPDMRRILMPYNYSEGHPLRKDFPLRGRFTRAEQTRRALAMRTEDHYSPQELEWAERHGQPLPDPMAEGGPGQTNAMPGGGGI